MALFILSGVALAVMLGLLVWAIKTSLSKKNLLPSGKRIPTKEKLWEMTSNQMAGEYSKEDLNSIRRYISQKIAENNAEEFSKWSEANRRLYIALYGWTGKN